MKGSFEYLFSVRLHLKEPGVRMSSAYQPSTCMFLGPERKGIPPHPTVLPHHPSPHPTPPLPGGLLSSPRGGGRNLPGHELLAVFPQALWSSDQSAPMPSSGASLPPQPSVPCKGNIGAALAECRDILPKLIETVLGLLNEPSHTQRTKKLRC